MSQEANHQTLPSSEDSEIFQHISTHSVNNSKSIIIPTSQAKSKNFTRIAILFVLAAIAGIGFVVSKPLRTPEPDKTIVEEAVRALPVKTITLEKKQFHQLVRTYTGQIVARKSSDLSLERSGTITEIYVEEGTEVEKGDILARLDIQSLLAREKEIQSQLAQELARLAELKSGPREETIAAAKASVRQLEAELDLEKVRLARRESLQKEGAIALEQLDEAISSFDSLNARLDAARSNLQELLEGTRIEQIQAQEAVVSQLEASLNSLAVDISKSTLKAPFSGKVYNRFVDEGTVISPGNPIVGLIDRKALEARIGVPIDAVESINLGDVRQLHVGDRVYRAPVSAILPVLDESTRTAILVLDLPLEVKATPQQLVEMELEETVKAEGFWLPTTALIPSVQGLWSAFVLSTEKGNTDTNGVYRVERREVQVLDTKGDSVLVRGTLQSGERLISSGVHKITPERLVRPSSEIDTPNAKTQR